MRVHVLLVALLALTFVASGIAKPVSGWPKQVEFNEENNVDSSTVEVDPEAGPKRSLLALRDDLMDEKIDAPYESSHLSTSMLRSFPRFRLDGSPAPSRIPSLRNSSYSEKEDEFQAYVEGAVLIVLIPIVLAVLMGVFCFLFCWMRCCCNTCGHRNADRQYTFKERNITRIGMGTTILGLFIFAMIGYSANIGISKSIDHIEVSADKTVDFMIDIVDLVNSTRSVIGDPVLNLLQDLNSTIFDVIPSEAELNDYIDCMNETFSILDDQQSLIASLGDLDERFQNVKNVSAVKNELLVLQGAIDGLPDLNSVATNLDSFSTTLTSKPDLSTIKSDLQAVDDVRNNNSVSAIADTIEQLQWALGNHTSAAVRGNLATYEGAISGTPDLPTLHSDIDTPGAKADIQTGLLNLESAVAAMPDPATMIADYTALNESLSKISTGLNVKGDIQALEEDINALPDLDALSDSLNSVGTYINSVRESLNTTYQDVSNLDSSLSEWPSTDPLKDAIANLSARIDHVKDYNLTEVGMILRSMNETLGGVTCILPLFEVIQEINDTLIQLPSDMDDILNVEAQIQEFVANITVYQDLITSGYDNVMAVSSDLDNIPDLSNLTGDIETIDDALASFPNFTDVLSNLESINDTLSSVPDLDQYTTAISNLNSTLDIDFSSLISAIDALQTAFSAIPDLQPYIDNANDLDASLTDITTKIDDVQTFVDANGDGTPIPAGTKDPLLALITLLDNTITGRPSSSDLTTSLLALDAAIGVAPDMSPYVTDIRELGDSLANFPNVASLTSSLDDLSTVENGNDDLDALVSGDSLSDMTSTLDSMPQPSETIGDLDELVSTIDEVSISSITDGLDFGSSDYDREGMLDQLGDIIELRNDMPDLDEYIVDLQSAIDDFGNQTNDAYEMRADYEDSKEDLNEKKVIFDGIRLLIFNIVIFLPFLASTCGLCSMVFRKGCCSMLMTLLFFPTMMVVLIFAAIQMPIAVVIGDHCPHKESIIKDQLAGKTFSVASLNNSLLANLTSTDVDAEAAFDYYALCNGEMPEFHQKLQENPITNYLQREDINVTRELDELEEGTESRDAIILRPALKNLTSQLDSFVPVADDVVVAAADLFACRRTAAIYDTWLEDTLCTRINGAWSMTAVFMLLSAGLMFFGLFWGCCGRKRFNRVNYVPIIDKKLQEREGDGEESYPSIAEETTVGPSSPSVQSPYAYNGVNSQPMSPMSPMSPMTPLAPIRTQGPAVGQQPVMMAPDLSPGASSAASGPRPLRARLNIVAPNGARAAPQSAPNSPMYNRNLAPMSPYSPGTPYTPNSPNSPNSQTMMLPPHTPSSPASGRR